MADGGHLYLVDGSGFIFRAYHAMAHRGKPLTRDDGTPVGAVYGFSTMLMKLMQDLDDADTPTHLAVIFDTSRKTFRSDIYPEYKAHRPPPPEDLIPQFAIIRDAVKAFGVPSLEMAGFEADDLIATYARMAGEAGMDVTIVSSDKDLMQLLNPSTDMYDSMKNVRTEHDGVQEKFGVGPERVVDVQALAGDSVDNVPGVPGIGIKTAAQLINEYGDLETLLSRASEIKQNKRRENLIEFADLARVSKKLVELDQHVPVEVGLDAMAISPPDAEDLVAFLDAQQFRSLKVKVMAKWGQDLPEDPVSRDVVTPEKDYRLITDIEELKGWVDGARTAGLVAVDTETTSLNVAAAELVGVSLSTRPGHACYIPLAHKGAGDGLLVEEAPKQIAKAEALALLKPLFEDPSVLKIGQNLKYDMGILAGEDIHLSPIDDTMLMSYALDAGKHAHGMDDLAGIHLDMSPIPFSEVAGKGKDQVTFDRVPLDKATDYAAEDADITLRLWQVLKPRLAKDSVTGVYERLERPLAPVLAAMERGGIKVDAGVLTKLSQDFAVEIDRLEKDCHALAGHSFNVNSPKQLGEILFEEMGIKGGKKSKKTGAWTTNAEVLEGLAAEGHALPEKVLEYRSYAKLRSTYTEALIRDINPRTGRVHTSFHMASTTTGRLSSNDPNLQNIPIRTEAGRKIRRAFIAEPGHILLAADYSQVELRLLAHIAGIDALKEAFLSGTDIHAMTASEVFGVPLEGMDPIVRRQAKAINFGIIYGISAFGLARQLGIARGEAQTYITAYFEKFPGIRRYMDTTIEAAKADGYVSTLFGRKCHIGALADKNPARRSFGERAAINAPIQGSAADIIRRAMIRMPEALGSAGLSGTRMLLQVHDELVFEVPEADADKAADVIKNTMEGAAAPAVKLTVPLTVDVGRGDNWDDAH